MNIYHIGIDLGGTKIAIGIVGNDGKILAQDTYDTPKTSKEDILHLLRTSVEKYIKIAEEYSHPLGGIGIGTAGQVNSKEGIIVSGTDNIKDWNNIEIRALLAEITELPIYIDNDANTFALAEYYLGHGKASKNIVALTLGTGIGGGVIIDGQLLRGEWGGAGELGHITVNMKGPKCNCGSRGCLEMYASGTGMANRMRKILKEDNPSDSSLAKIDTEKLTSKEVIQWHKEGISQAVTVIEEAIQALTFGMISFIHTFNPTKIILGGGIVEHNPWLIQAIKEKLYNHGMKSLVQNVAILQSKAGYNAGLIGASLLPLINVEESRKNNE